MKTYYFMLLFFILSLTNSIYAQEEIKTIHEVSYLGFIVEDVAESVTIIEENNSRTTISKANIKERQRVYMDVFLKNETVIKASLINHDKANFTFINLKGERVVHAKAEIDYFLLNGRRIDFSNSIIFDQAVNIVCPKDKFICLGGEIGTPSILNISYTNYDEGNSGWKLTLGADLGGSASGEAAYLIRLMRSKSLIMNVILGGGVSNKNSYKNKALGSDTESYLTAGGDLNYYGIFLKLAAGVYIAKSPLEVFPNISIGYVYRFDN